MIPTEWRHTGSKELADAVGYGHILGPAAAASNDKPAYIWYDKKDVRQTMPFSSAHANARDLGALIRAGGVEGKCLNTLTSEGTLNVGLVLKRTAALPLSQLAVFKAGATFVPIDPTWPAERTTDILAETDASVVVIDVSSKSDELASRLFKSTKCATIILVDERCCIQNVMLGPSTDRDSLYRLRDEARALMKAATATSTPEASAHPWSSPEIMYLMYTSGSTGKPKGCIVPTGGVWHRFKWGTKLLEFSSDDIFVLKTPSTFDCSIPEMWMPMCLGCTSVVICDGSHLDFEHVRQMMERTRVTVAHFVPSVLALFLDFVSAGDLPALRQISCTGEALLLSHREKLTSKLGRPLPLINLYGPTEAAVEVTYFVATDDYKPLDASTHGFPIGFAGDDGVLMYVTDVNDPSKLMPDGEKGEICIGGVQVAYGYLHREALSREKFLPNPHGAPGLLYRTGDLGIKSKDGCLTYNGRADRQVKVGGVRIELGEIEAVVLKLFPQLLNVAVEKVDERLVGVAAPRPGQSLPSALEVQAVLADAVPAAYVPAEWHFRDALPLGSAGKVDHKQVLAWVEDQAKASMWGAIYDELYFANDFQVDDGVDDPTMDWAAYTDSFTNEMHERGTIKEWVDETVAEVLERQPRSVVEMGCGKGMILFKVAADPCVATYVGCDLSRLAIKHVERVWKSHVAADADEVNGTPAVTCNLSTHMRDASNFAGLGDRAYDAVVCNGVSMYFPSATYLVSVLSAGLPKLRPTGCYHFGDVISRPHYDLFLVRRSRHFEASFESIQQPEVRKALFSAAKDRTFDHDLFYALMMSGALPGVAAVELQLKHGRIMSEFNRYRYNVLLHLGEQVEPLALVAVPEDCSVEAANVRASAESIAFALAMLAKDAPGSVVACHGIPNARLTADALLFAGESDAAAPAVQEGVGDGGGIDPATLRAALASALPAYRVVLQWARDSTAEHMDVYAYPLADPYPVTATTPNLCATKAPPATAQIAPGLAAIMASATARIGPESLIKRASNVESFTNKLQTVDEGSDGKRASSNDEAMMAEARKLWSEGRCTQAKITAVLTLLGAKTGAGGPVQPNDSFASSGGNSFVAMQAIGAVRSVFGVSMPVFELLTNPYATFAQGVVAKGGGGSGAKGTDGWVSIIDHSNKWGHVASLSAPTFVFFPQAGSSPKQYARLYKSLHKRCPTALYLFVQPPGRDARVDEEHETGVQRFISETSAALKPYLIGPDSKDGPTTFIGDSWGAIAAFAVAHELREQCGWEPDHMAVSGNASPEITSSHNGLGSYCPQKMAELSDDALKAFLRDSGVDDDLSTTHDNESGDDSGSGSEGDGASAASLSNLVDAFRADCQLYEDYVRPSSLPKLSASLMVLRGAEDAVVKSSEILGWAEEFDCEEARFVRVPKATHHLHEEQADAVAELLINQARLAAFAPRVVTVPQPAYYTTVEAPPRTKTPEPPKSPVAPRSPAKQSVCLPAPLPFMKGVDHEALQSFREGNILYRMGSASGSKGEIANLVRASSEWPVRTDSPY